MNDLISIITPAYNAQRFIEATIQSVMQQTYQKWEHLIVIDHNSSDQTEVIVKNLSEKDSRVKCITSPKALGAANNRNIGLEKCTGKYIAFLDADDLWTKDKLEKQIRFMKTNNYAFTFTAYSRIDEQSKLLGEMINVPEKVSYSDLLINNHIGCLTAMIEREKFTNVSFIETGWEDLNLWLRLLKQTRYAYSINEVLGYYRIVNGSRSNNKIYSAKRKWDTLRKVERLGMIPSIYYFSHYAITGLLKHKRL